MQSGGDYAITRGDFSSWRNESIQGSSTRIPPTSYHSKNLNVPWSTFGQLGKNVITRGLGAYGVYQSLKSLIEGAGWAIDELTKQVMDGEERPPEMRAAGTQMVCWNGRCSTTAEGLVPAINSLVAPLYVVNIRERDWNFQTYDLDNTGAITAAWGVVAEWTPDWGTGHTPSPVTDQQLGNLMSNHPDVLNAVLIDPSTGRPIMIPPLVNALNELRQALEAQGVANGETVQPGTDIIVSPPPYQPEPAPASSSSEWPGFCSWATVVCDFIDWWRVDESNKEPVEVPIEEAVVEEVEWESGLGGGSCPAPYTVSVLDGEVEFSWDGICGFVETVRPFLIAISMLVGAFIVAGQRSGKSA